MELKTKIVAEDNSQELTISRVFDLPVELLFKAYEDSELFEQWMETKVLKMENRNHGSYVFETSRDGIIVFRANGTIHEFVKNEKIIRTFEMEQTPFPVQLEFLEFEKISKDTSLLTIRTIFKSVEFRNQLLKMPFAQGLNMAHNRLQNLLTSKK